MKKRIISIIVAAVIVIPLFLLGGIPFAVGVGLLAALAFKETLDLKESHKPYPIFVMGLAFVLLELLVIIGRNESYIYNGINFALIGLTTILLTIPAIFDEKGKYQTKDSLYLIGTVVLLGIFFHLLILIENANKWLLMYLFLTAAITDTFAMLIGCLIGKHKLIPKVSPKKSVEGSIAGSLMGTIVSSIYFYNIVSKINIVLLIVITLILTILGQLGDLYFSKIKRENNIKDFSNIMPGHGGILDRLDSMTFIVIGYVVILNIIRLF